MEYPFVRPKYYYSLFKDIVGFVKKPENREATEKSTKFKVYDTIGLFVVKILCLIPISILVGLIHDPENLTKSSMAERFSPLMLLLVTVLILPMVEEVAFRLSLKFKPIYLALTSGVFLYYVLTKAVFGTKISAVDETFLTRIVLSIGLVLLLYPLLNMKSISKKLAEVWTNHFRSIYYVSCITFAWIHVFNYEFNLMNLLFLPLITLPQLMTGIISGYTRVAFGFRYPLFFHMATNLIALGLSLLPFAD
ncbi:CPBP family glutamic-type intramembrane protease [Neolewinella persica]|uniref:CPBP family glutamic-type intramembrane protease n=1 Tax=Neolewinella persica TaxID=70998 RepID=UPI000378FF93|nr:CPBP family glutamic-type intramembrane protease [Neolewinella persica]